MTTQREERAAKVAEALALPELVPDLCELAAVAADDYHAAILGGDEQMFTDARERYEAIIWRMNGGAFFGCADGDSSPVERVARWCAVAPGTVPHWGRRGAFVVEANGVQGVAEVDTSPTALGGGSIRFYVLDAHRPFISETGFRAHFFVPQFGATVGEVVQAIFAAFVSKGLTLVDPDHRERAFVPEWAEEVAAAPVAAYVDQRGQHAFAF